MAISDPRILENQLFMINIYFAKVLNPIFKPFSCDLHGK